MSYIESPRQPRHSGRRTADRLIVAIDPKSNTPRRFARTGPETFPMLARIALESEAAAVVELARLQMAESLPHLEFDQDIAHRTFASYLASASPTIFVVEGRGREPVGFLTAHICNYEFAGGFYVVRNPLFVRADYRDTEAAAVLQRAYDEWAARLSPLGAYAMEAAAPAHAPAGYAAAGIFYRREVS